MTDKAWSTWSHQHSTTPTDLLAPRSALELAAQVQDAAASGQRVKVVGRGRSASAVAPCLAQCRAGGHIAVGE